jgi:hypothetical protein
MTSGLLRFSNVGYLNSHQNSYVLCVSSHNSSPIGTAAKYEIWDSRNARSTVPFLGVTLRRIFQVFLCLLVGGIPNPNLKSGAVDIVRYCPEALSSTFKMAE